MNGKTSHFPTVMKSIAVITAIATAILIVLYHLAPLDWLFSAAISFGSTCYHFSMRLLVGLIVPLFAKNASYNHSWFQHQNWETILYNRLNVRNWKRNLPTYDPSQFDLTQNTLEQVIHNTCSAELVHEVIIVCSFIPLLFTVVFGSFPVFLITSVAAALYDSIFVIAQRYNRPRLVRILHKRRRVPIE